MAKSLDLELAATTKIYGETIAVDAINHKFAAGTYSCLLGPSGCGKSSTLRMIAGHESVSTGDIVLGGTNITDLPPARRGTAMMFQNYALFPHLSVVDNVAFSQKMKGVEKPVRLKKARQLLELVDMAAYAERLPSQLSGGQQQRVALARSVAPRPAILLFDEPLSNLDAQLREEMQIEIKRLQSELKLTSLFVTHDQHEAMSLSDRICLMSGGNIQQFATPEEVYFSPANGFVSGFVGSPNKLTGVLRDGAVELAPGLLLPSSRAASTGGGRVRVTLRQEDLVLAPQGPGLPGTITMRIFEGASVQYIVTLDKGPEVMVRVSSRGAQADLEKGTAVAVSIPADRVFVSAEESAA